MRERRSAQAYSGHFREPFGAHILGRAAVSERNVVRTGAFAIAAGSVVLPMLMSVPPELPATAMGSALLLYFERLVAVFAVLLFLLVFLYRGLVRGELPKAISGRGAEWQEIVETTASNADRVQAQLDALRDEVDALKQQTEAPKP